MTNLKYSTRKQLTRGAISIWTFILLGLLLIVIGISAIGYRLLSERLAESKKKTVDISIIIQSNKVVLDKLLADQQEKKRVQQEKEIAAKFKRDSFVIEARGLTNDLSVALSKVEPAIANWKEFMDGPTGRPVAKHEDLVKLADLYVNSTPMNLSAEQGKSQLEFVRTVLFTVQEMQGDADPGNTYTETLSNAKVWIRKTEMEIQARAGFISQILRQAERKTEEKSEIPELSLTLAIEWVKGAIIVDKKRTEVKIDTETRTQNDLLAKKAAQDKLQREREEFEREQARIRQELQARLAKEKLIAEAQSAETRDLLRPFLETGVYDQTRRPLPKPGPVSLRSLSTEVGGFEGGKSVERLMGAASDSRIDRFRWPKTFRDPQLVQKAQRAMDKLNRLGPTLVELGMLNP
jgi:hypothetical protein